MSLARALQHLRAGREEQALDALLGVWRKRPAGALSELIEKLSGHLIQQRPMIASASREQSQRDWLAMASRMQAMDVPLLVDGVRVGSSRLAEARVWALHSFPRDPRIASQLVRLLAEDFAVSSRFWQRALEVIARHSDRRIWRQLDRVHARLEVLIEGEEPQLRVRSRLAALRRKFHDIGPPLSNEERRLVRDLNRITRQGQAQLRHESKREEQLLAAIYAVPDRDEPRQVYADFLSERGDVRGEFILLQLLHHQGHITLDQLRRERVLLAANAAKWLGPLGEVLQRTGLVFERGFVAGCRAAPHADTARKLRGHPAWATVRHLHLHTAIADELFDPAMRSLERVTGLRYEGVIRLARQPDAWPKLLGVGCTALTDGESRDHPAELARRALLACGPIGNLRELSFAGEVRGPQVLRWLWSSAVGQRLERLTSFMGTTAFAGWPSERVPPSLVELVRWSPDLTRGWIVVLRPWEGILNATWVGDREGPGDPVGELTHGLRAVRKGALTEVRVLGARGMNLDIGRLARVARRLGATLKVAK